MKISEERIQEMKKIMQKNSKEEITNDQAREAAYNLTRYVEIVWEVAKRHGRNERRLRKESDGFAIDGQYSCMVCGNGINEQTGWFHWGGQRCLLCHKAVLDGTIPQFILKNKDSYFSVWALSIILKMKNVSIYKLVRQGQLKARIVLNESGKPHEYIFLKKENPGIREWYGPERKSYDRHREKMSKKSSIELKEEMTKDLRMRDKRSQKN